MGLFWSSAFSISFPALKILSAIQVETGRVRFRVSDLKFPVLSFRTTVLPPLLAFLHLKDTFSLKSQSVLERLSESAISLSKVVSEEILFASRSGETILSSSPRESLNKCCPTLPYCFSKNASSRFWRCPIVFTPLAESFFCMACPTPHIFSTGIGASLSSVSDCPMTVKPFGLSRSEDNLARNLLWLRPTDTVMPTVLRMFLTRFRIVSAGVSPCSFSVPRRSKKASSIEIG